MIVKSIFLSAAITLAIAASPARAEDKPALTPGIVEQLDLAAKLTNYCVERNDPLLLLAAARIITTIGPEAAAGTPALGADELIARANAIAGGSADIKTLGEAIASESSRGLCYGSGTVYGCF